MSQGIVAFEIRKRIVMIIILKQQLNRAVPQLPCTDSQRR